MAGFAEYDRYDGLGLAALVRGGQVSAEELVEEALARIAARNPAINAVVRTMADEGRASARAGAPSGPFQGVPFLLKDLLAAYAGVPLTSGSRALADFVPDHDSELVRRFKAAGLMIVGKTSLPELGLLGYTEPALFGPCRNPWDLSRTPGGSSGGSAAAVAAGIVPLASGGDGGGSIRIPASCCGLFGLKPTRGRNPTGPDYGQIWQGAVVEHVLSRSVRDSAAALDATQGGDRGAPYVIAPPERPYLDEVSREPGRLRVAFSTASPVGREVHPQCVEAVQRAAALLEGLGHSVEEATPAVDGRALGVSYIVMNCGEVAADLARLRATLGARRVRRDVELITRTLGLLGRAISAGEFVGALREWDRAGRAMATFFDTYDLYLTPTLAVPPVKVGELAPKPAERAAVAVMNALHAGGPLKAAGVVQKMGIDNLAATPFTTLANATGLPAASLPLHWSPDGLPIGVQLVAPFGDEGRLFRVAGQLERAQPWFDRRPAV
jgi:amidase